MGGRQNGPPTSPMPLSDIEKTKLDQRKAASDAVMAERHREFDLSSKDNHFKYERAHFAVVGEGTKSARKAYSEGWERTFGKHSRVSKTKE